MSNWNGLDFFIFLIFFLNTVLGMSRGASKEIISMMCLSVALIFTLRFTVPLTAWLNTSPLIESVIQNKYIGNFMAAMGAQPVTGDLLGGMSYAMSFLICFVGVFCVTEAALNFTGFVETFTFPWAVWSRKVGAALGCTRGYVLTLVFISILMHIAGRNGSETISNALATSSFVSLFQSSVQRMDSLVAGQQVEQYQQIFQDKNLYTPQDIYRTVPPPATALPSPPSTSPQGTPSQGTSGTSTVVAPGQNTSTFPQ